MAAICCPKCQSLVSENASSCYQCGAVLGKLYQAERASRTWMQDFDFPRTLVGLILLVYITHCLVLGFDPLDRSLSAAFTPNPKASFAGGRMIVPLIQFGEWWRLVTAIFVHLDLMHLIFNTMAIIFVTPKIVEFFGVPKAVILFVGTGIVGNLASYAFGLGGGGASGSICGFIGVLLYYGYKRGGTEGAFIVRMMLMWAIFIAIFGLLQERVNNAAHAGGFVAGLLLAPLVGMDRARLARTQNVLAVLCVALVVVSWALTLWYFDDNLKLAAEVMRSR